MSAVPFAAGIATTTQLRELDSPVLLVLRLAEDDSLVLHQEWIAECVRRGVTSHHNHVVDAALTSADVARTVEVAHEAFGVLRDRHPGLGGEARVPGSGWRWGRRPRRRTAERTGGPTLTG
ncbi:hypothetical protein [Cellulomonas sp. C5510]|uniref:hypothetical protein n=1 Tax=Cellulomonas sp. C5510 TaxID=2871170 RepID=UPI001C944526|nr:hypothetical protein [Cellulomonas sp. C5510]QZN85881.1 hypothetical protein K5O09_01230 [Cellulomonas sp. C5510]